MFLEKIPEGIEIEEKRRVLKLLELGVSYTDGKKQGKTDKEIWNEKLGLLEELLNAEGECFGLTEEKVKKVQKQFKEKGYIPSKLILIICALFSFFVTFTLAGVEATFQLFQIENIQITPLQLGYLFMVSGFADAAIQGGVVRRIKDGAETKWLIGAQIVTAIGLFLIVASSNLVMAGLALAVFTAGNALARTCVVALTSKESGGKYGLPSESGAADSDLVYPVLLLKNDPAVGHGDWRGQTYFHPL